MCFASPGRRLLEVHVQTSLIGADEDLQPQLEIVWVPLERERERDREREERETETEGERDIVGDRAIERARDRRRERYSGRQSDRESEGNERQ